jgi:hypothetical protein
MLAGVNWRMLAGLGKGSMQQLGKVYVRQSCRGLVDLKQPSTKLSGLA